MFNSRIKIFGLNINVINYDDLLNFINDTVSSGAKKYIAYANAHVLNGIYCAEEYKNFMSGFDIIYPDGIGIYFASKFIFGKTGLKKRFNGSDFYPLLASKAIEKKWKVFFFGHHNSTLEKISSHYPEINIAGINEGYDFIDEEVVKKINAASPDLLVIGLGFPKQEIWLAKNMDKINAKVSIIVGDGIKVFAGTKRRGPKILRALGLEWLYRLILYPFLYSKRYIIGNPLFLYRIFKYKLSNLSKKP